MSRPIVFDTARQAQVCALIAMGHTKLDAARFVGCSLRTIRYHTLHNPAFRGQFSRAQAAAKIRPLERLSRITNRAWRGAVWMLLQLNPHDQAALKLAHASKSTGGNNSRKTAANSRAKRHTYVPFSEIPAAN